MRKETGNVTLFDVIAAVQDSAKSDTEAVAAIAHLLDSGQVRLGRPLQRRERADLVSLLAA